MTPYNYPIKTSTFYTNTPTYGSALNPTGGVVNLATGVPATPTVAFSSTGTLQESAANGTIGLANLYIPLNFRNAYVSSWNAVVQQALPDDMSLQLAYRVLPRLLDQLRIIAGRVEEALQQRGRPFFRGDLGQGAKLPDRRTGRRAAVISGNLRRNYNVADFDRTLNYEVPQFRALEVPPKRRRAARRG